MISEKDLDEYIQHHVSEKHQAAYRMLWKTLQDNIPEGFESTIQYSMPGWVVPYTIFPQGYHCDGKPLGFISVGGQKHHLGLYHMGIYMDESLLKWFIDEYQKLNIGKLDMGKSCIRFKNPNKIPYELIAQLVRKMSVNDYLSLYHALDPRSK